MKYGINRRVLVASLGGTLVTLFPIVTRAQRNPFPPRLAVETGLASMLAHVPATFAELEQPDQAIMTYADLATQLAAVDAIPPDTMDDEAFGAWFDATMGLPLAMPAAQYLNSWREDYGFDLLQADRTFQLSLPPFELSLYQGRFDEQAILRNLENLGYVPIADDGSILAIRGDYEQDIGAETAYKLAAMNFSTILEDGTLVFASARGIVEAVVAVQASDLPSLAARSDLAPLLANVPEDLVSAFVIDGRMLAGSVPEELLDLDPLATPDIDAIATEIAEQGAMPPVVMAQLGSTAGGPIQTSDAASIPDGHAMIAVLMDSSAAADIAASIVEERLSTEASIVTERPFAEMFPQRTVTVHPESAVVVIELAFGEETRREVLMQMVFARDLSFLAW